jgi:hypothetical protein
LGGIPGLRHYSPRREHRKSKLETPRWRKKCGRLDQMPFPATLATITKSYVLKNDQVFTWNQVNRILGSKVIGADGGRANTKKPTGKSKSPKMKKIAFADDSAKAGR